MNEEGREALMTSEHVLSFPYDFFWGTATSAHQVEGDNRNNDWWAWEMGEGHVSDGSRSGLACDWWRRAEEDLDRARQMGHNAHRLSVEWSRIEPQEGQWDVEAIARYREILTALHERGLEPMVTLHHFTNPLWLASKGGWTSKETVGLFDRFVARVVEELGDLVSLWCTLNEPHIYAVLGYLMGRWPPGRSSLRQALRVLRNMMQAHGRAYHTIHRLQGRARVGIAHAMRFFEPADPSSPLDRAVVAIRDHVFNQLPLTAVIEGRLDFPLGWGQWAPRLVDSTDFLGLNYYSRETVAFDRASPDMLFSKEVFPEGVEMSDGDYGQVYPEGLYQLLKRLAAYRKPIYVTENGLPDEDDDQRPRFLLTHLAAVQRAIAEGLPVRGYFHWTLVDNFEWAEGWSLRFGLIALDAESQARTMRRSGELYSEICHAGAITEGMVAR